MVYVPFVSSLGKRKGGGKGGGKASGSSSSGGTSGSSSSGGTKGSISSGGTSKTTTTYGGGTSKVSTIPSGQLFAGRQTGGGTRTALYGSGYPIGYYPGGVYHHGVAGRGFPFFFWPLVWGSTAGFGAAYLWASILDYGSPNNGSRPGGPEMQMRIESPNAAQVYHIISDRDTVGAMVEPLQTACPDINNQPLLPIPFDGSSGQPKPELAIQYYRASSVALTLNNYNNTASFSDDESLPATPLPSGIDLAFLNCLNTTIGAAVQQQAFWMMCVALLVAVRNAW
ncbi:hypothetical protein BKA62DRAFT_709009 [Auriculariales sp. MPI-PUGE-AT-0066]|nr:hypothetical protein BKA62DRAFT_709009 [Auriculariales sp. MPI-PUGE-AT-0066]